MPQLNSAVRDFCLDPFEPCYLQLARSEQLAARVASALDELEDCCACPRNCHVNRLLGESKVCHSGRHARVASAFPHQGEEDCLRGWAGSGTIFFSSCNLRCVFCQNWDISPRPTKSRQPAPRRGLPVCGVSTNAGSSPLLCPRRAALYGLARARVSVSRSNMFAEHTT